MGKKTTSEGDQLPLPSDVRTIRNRNYRVIEAVKYASEAQALLGDKVKVRLTNGGDQALLRRGMLPPDQVRYYETTALVHTGAIRSVLPGPGGTAPGVGSRAKGTGRLRHDSREDVAVSEMVGIRNYWSSYDRRDAGAWFGSFDRANGA